MRPDANPPLPPVTPGSRPVPAARRPVLVINPLAGGGKALRRDLAARARDRGIEAVEAAPGDDVAALVATAVDGGADVVGVAGGDGSLARAADVARRAGVPFVCVPAGTRNHFALDLGVARNNPVGALRAFGAAVERRVDVAHVNGRAFLNNVSLGIYGDAVRRPGYRDAKVRTLFETARAALAASPAAPALRVVDDEGAEHDHPAVVLVSNNPYLSEGRPRTTRARLDGGVLGVVLLERPEQRGQRRGRAWTATALEVGASAVVHAGIDGEPVALEPPLRFTVLHAALRVRVAATRAARR